MNGISTGEWILYAGLILVFAWILWPRGAKVGSVAAVCYGTIDTENPWWYRRFRRSGRLSVRRAVRSDPSAPVAWLYGGPTPNWEREQINPSEAVRIAELLEEAVAAARQP